MKKTIFYRMKIMHVLCKIFRCSFISLIFSNFNLMKIIVFKRYQFYLMVLFMLFAFQPYLYSQAVSGAAVKANFGIDADVYANKEQFLVPPTISGIYDDWFFSSAYANGTGENVIDQSNAAGIKTSIQANNNFTFEKRMSKPKNTMVGNFLWIDAVYGRDGNSTQNNSDSNIFSGNSNKNGDNPATWALGSGSIPQKDDIVDVYGYLRRDLSPAALAINPNGVLWGYGGASKISSDGNSHFDFEFFRTEVTFNGSALVGTGGQSGHTAWTFDGTGKILVPGDVIVAIDFENGGTKPIASVRVWMSSADIATFNSKPNRPFDLTGVFDQGNGAPPYGYAEINAKGGGINGDVFAVVNVAAPTLGPPWGTLRGSQASFQNDYEALQFTEFGLNLTALGLDSRNVNQSPCSNLLGSLLVKTRSSSSFTSELKDFSGPFLFGNITDVAVVGNVSNPLTCNNPTATLTATPTPANATIKWYGPSPDGIADGPFIAGNAPVVSVKGIYTVYAYTNLEGCFAKKTVTVLENKEPPNVNAGDDKALTCLITSIQLSGSSSTPNATYLWSTLDGNIVSGGTTLTPTIDKAGTYTLTVTDPINGCQASDTVLVTNTPPTPIDIVCPADNIKSSCFYVDQAAVDAAFEIFKQGFTASGGNGTLTTSGLENLTPPALCGGSVTVNFNVTDSCGLQKSCSATFTITAPAAVVPVSPDPFTASACAYADQAALDAAFAAFKQGFSVSGGCDPKGVFEGNPVAPNLCQGGTTSVSYVVTDKCYTTTITKDFTITKVDLLNVSSPPNKTVICGEDADAAFVAWIAGFKYTGGCLGNVQATDLSQFVKPQLGVPLVIEYVVSNNCETIKKVSTFLITPCITPICTYTQGYYGNIGGMSCAGGVSYTTKALIAKSLSTYPGGTMTIGLVGKSVLVSNNPTDIDAVIEVLPGGGTSKVLLNGNPHISALPPPYLKKGNINNTLLAQTITLGLNLGIDSELSKFKLQAGILAVAEPAGGCGSKTPKERSCNPDGTVSNEYKFYTIPNTVVSKLGGDKTVGDLFNLANQALGGGNTNGASLSDIASLVDLINNAFDQCRISIGYNIPPLACIATQEPIVAETSTTTETVVVESSGKESNKASFVAYPVPFKNYIIIHYNFDYASDVKIELFDLSGTLLSSKTDTNSYLDKEYTFNIDFYIGKFQVYILKVTTSKGSSTKKIISAGY